LTGENYIIFWLLLYDLRRKFDFLNEMTIIKYRDFNNFFKQVLTKVKDTERVRSIGKEIFSSLKILDED